MLKKLLLFSIICLLISCNSQNNVSRNDVELFMNDYFENVKQNNFKLIESYYSDAFYEATDRDSWEELYNKIHSALGELISTELISWHINSTVSTSGSGRNFRFIYDNKYKNGNATETINIICAKRHK